MKNKIILITTILASVLFLFWGNKIAAKDFPDPTNGQGMESQEAVVTEITGRSSEKIDMEGSSPQEASTISFHAKLLTGGQKGKTVTATQSFQPGISSQMKEVEAGDKLILIKSENEGSESQWVAGDYVRTDALMVLGGLFALSLLFFGRSKGLHTIISLVFTCLAVFAVFIPAILSGKNIYFWAILTSSFIIVMSYLIVNDANKKTLAAGLGCLGGILVSGAITAVMSPALKLTGVLDEDSMYLLYINEKRPIDLKAIIFAAILIGAIGAIMDVSMSISSSLSEISRKNRSASFHDIFRSGMEIGRDVMGTMTNTLILAYIGGSLSVVLLLMAYNTSLLQVLNREMVVVDILQALVGSFGILFAIPFTSFVCAAFYSKNQNDGGHPKARPSSNGT
ncbi:YibE/F family protein [Ruminococcaceae bacterium BL-6]|nr:YibE/F family protein [Ruminococcaceae bacterium BL-6]